MKNTLKITCLWSLLLLGLLNTQAAQGYQTSKPAADTSSFTSLQLSKLELDTYLNDHAVSEATARAMHHFYQGRDFQVAWFTEEGFAEQAQIFWNLYEQYRSYSNDRTLEDSDLQEEVDLLGDGLIYDERKISGLELRFTHFFIRFLRHAYAGRVDPEKLQWHIPRKKLKIAELMHEFAANNDSNPENWLPVSDQYLAMQANLIRMKAIKNTDWPIISLGERRVLRTGDSASVVKLLKYRLYLMKDLPVADTTYLYNNEFKDAVKTFQKRHGLAADGIVGPEFMTAVNIPLKEKIKQMLINMERMRWMPRQDSSKRVVVNIPEFKLHLYENGKDVLDMDVVVGKSATRTVIFSDEIQHVVFSPYWNVPQSIVGNEILPGIEGNSDYLAQHHMEVTARRNGLPVVRQRPGSWNALGRVKFIFPNRYSIYLHDTPAKSLFNRTTRAFSHGCIRVSDPAALAFNLLEDKELWSERHIYEAMHAKNERWIKVTRPVPVFISYFTSWVDASGKLNFRKDVYGHDQKMAKHLFQNS